jgi:intein/homing endonuclease
MTENCYVLLKNGKHKKITDLTLEDEVQTETGKGKLIQIHERELEENDEVYEIETNDGATIQLTGNHIVPVFRDNKRIEIRVDEILKTDFLFTF